MRSTTSACSNSSPPPGRGATDFDGFDKPCIVFEHAIHSFRDKL
jgi:hypothetical protein